MRLVAAAILAAAIPVAGQEPAPVPLPIEGVSCTAGIPAICTDSDGRRVESSAWRLADGGHTLALPGLTETPAVTYPLQNYQAKGRDEHCAECLVLTVAATDNGPDGRIRVAGAVPGSGANVAQASDTPPVKSEPAPHPRTVQGAGMWLSKALTLANGSTWAERKDYWGGRLHLRIPVALDGKLALIGRADVVSVPGQSNPFANLGAAKAIEAYGGLEYVLTEYRGFDLAPAIIAGQVYQFATGSAPSVRQPPQTLAAAGLVAHHHKTGAWAAVLVGQYDAAGPGTRIILSGHFPVKKGFGVLFDWVSGAGGWARPGLAYGVSF